MAYQQVPLELARDGQGTPWGFRMTGGADIGTPLVIQKVTLGSPSEGEVCRGDIILVIRDVDATRLSHKAATDLILKTGSTLRLVVARNMTSSPSGVSTPTSIGTPPIRADTGSPFMFRPLPTTNFAQQQRQRRYSSESYNSTASSDMEKEAIVNQPFRSTPLILPGAKPNKDIPVGSYLRFDPMHRPSTPPNYGPRAGDLGQAYMLNKVQEAIFEAARCSSPGRTPTPEMGRFNGQQVLLQQYNSPIHMYSNQAIVEALGAQTVNHGPIHLSPESLEQKKPDITQSPTYQLIHGEELRKGQGEECQPLQEKVYNVPPRGGTDYKEDIHQSGSFKSIMHDLRGMSDN
ncbi:hypothetical protein JTE90_012785 [Oedothorax gibbosus]|uniref:PDZ domain-containing protein n=1 Tax=Oedothorax gibbosus TaxID=931172 RepID=A0AAV6VYK1_9ARAC|nr:hypothetical protein JTE90_012785 [Oedothorax gibbosus]